MEKDCGFQFDNSYLALPDCFYTRLKPVAVQSPEVVVVNEALINVMGLDFASLTRQEKAELFSGNILLKGGGYFAQAYAGHQFGHFTMLGDGRAIVWGEHTTPDLKKLDIQFKGSGRTPYSRSGDGRAPLGPMLREYIISESMHSLGIPTTRSLAVVTTGEPVIRECALPGAILTRVASSHLRIGTFEFAASQGNQSLIQSLLDYTIDRHYPDLINTDNKAVALLKAVMERQAELIVHWMRVGFIHGVMNTDNMTLSGETIDYGPCAFMDDYHSEAIFSSIDHIGRYAYNHQPIIAQWNLARLAESLLPFIHPDIKKSITIAEEIINLFQTIYQEKWLSMMRNKLGLLGKSEDDPKLISDLLEWMQTNRADYTNTFLELRQTNKPLNPIYQTKSFNEWHQRWQVRRQPYSQQLEESHYLMDSVNPAVIPRNHKVEQTLAAADAGDFNPLYDLLAALQQPYKNSDALKAYQAPPLPNERVYQTFCGT